MIRSESLAYKEGKNEEGRASPIAATGSHPIRSEREMRAHSHSLSGSRETKNDLMAHSHITPSQHCMECVNVSETEFSSRFSCHSSRVCVG